MYAFELAMWIERRERAAHRRADGVPARLTARLLETIPFQLTGAQRRTIEEIGADLARRAR